MDSAMGLSAEEKSKLDGSRVPQSIRALTDASGAYTWTFPRAFASGVRPMVQVSVEDNTASTWNHQITALTNTSVSVRLTRTNSVTVLGVSVLGVAASPQAFVHLIATEP